jgi:putative DNA primase/helicase
MSEISKTPDGAFADLVARLKQNEAATATADVIALRVSATGPHAGIIDYLANLDPVSRAQEIPEIAAGLTKDTGMKVTVGSLKEAVAEVERARKAAAKQTQLPEFEQPEEALDSEGRLTIKLRPPFRDKIPEAEAALKRPGMNVFVRGNKFVEPILQEVDTFKDKKTMSAEFLTLSKFQMMLVLSQAANWLSFNGLKGKWVAANPPKDFAAIVVEHAPKSTLPRASGLTTIPVFRHDGSLVTNPGHDPETGIFLMPDASLTNLVIPDRPAKSDAKAALDVLLSLFDEFPFVDESHKAGAVSATITPLARTAMRTAPMHVFNASTPRTGKTFLATLCAHLALGCDPPVAARGDSQAELGKRIDGWLMAGSLIRVIDNADGDFDSELLNLVLTNREVGLRMLSRTGEVKVVNNTCFFATGNNLTPIGALVGKTIESKLDANMEHPEEKEFKRDPLADLMADRGKYLTAAYTVLKAHACAGFPGTENLKPLASFGDWSRFVRGALVWLGMDDPVGSQKRMRQNDPERAKLMALVVPWAKVIGPDIEVSVKELEAKTRDMTNGIDLRSAFEEIAGKQGPNGVIVVDNQKLGIWFKANNGKVISIDGNNEVDPPVKARNLKFEMGKEDTHTKVKRWVVKDI